MAGAAASSVSTPSTGWPAAIRLLASAAGSAAGTTSTVTSAAWASASAILPATAAYGSATISVSRR